MECNYFKYQELTEKLFFGIALTDKHLNHATEQIRQYLINRGAGKTMEKLNIGIRITTSKKQLVPAEIIRQRFIWLDGARKGSELTIPEIRNIGLFLKYGPFSEACVR